MNFLCSTAVVYIKSFPDTIKPTVICSRLFSPSLEFLSMCGMQRSQINAIKSTKPFSFPHTVDTIWGLIWRYMEFHLYSCGPKICKHAPSSCVPHAESANGVLVTGFS